MTAQEIKGLRNDAVHWSEQFWLAEIAYQLALMNEGNGIDTTDEARDEAAQ